MCLSRRAKPGPFSIERDSTLSDLAIECGEKKFPVHRVVIFSASPVIKAAVEDERFAEGVTNVFKIRDFEADTVEQMIDYIYTRDYDDPEGPDATTADRLMSHVKVNALADCYDVPGLRELANQKIEELLRNSWCSEGFGQFVQASFDLSSDEELHKLTSSVAALHVDELIECSDFRDLKVPGSFHNEVLTVEHWTLKKEKADRIAFGEALRASKQSLSKATFVAEVTFYCVRCGFHREWKVNTSASDMGAITVTCQSCGYKLT